MSRKTVTEAGVVVLTLGILASPARAQPIKLVDAQMDNVTAGAFTITTDPLTGVITLGGNHNGAPVALTSMDGGKTFTSTTGPWTTQVLYISTTQRFAVGILSNGNQYWDGESQLPPTYVLKPDRVIIPQPIKPAG